MSAFKGVIVGDRQVGKTSLMVACNTDSFFDWPHPNVFDTFLLRIADKSVTTSLEIWDTSGEDGDIARRPNVHHGANVYLLCFKVNDSSSYYNARDKWYPEIRRCAPEVPIILVGTQSDMRQGNNSSSHGIVTQQMGQQLMNEIEARAYVECSALQNTCVVNVFAEAVRYAQPASLPSGAGREGTIAVPSWLVSYADAHLYEQAIEHGAEKADLATQFRAAIYLDRLYSSASDAYSPPAWTESGSNEMIFSMAVANGAQASDLLTVDSAHHFWMQCALPASEVIFLPAPPSWVVNASTMEIFRDAFSKKIPPKKLNSRADTELFLLNIEAAGRSVSCWSTWFGVW